MCHKFVMQTSEALSLFSRIMDHPFTMAHCWDIIKNEVKWMEYQNKAKDAEGTGRRQHADNLSGFDENASNSVHMDGECSFPSSGLGKRPIGRDSAKQSRKRSTSSSQSSSYFVSSMHDMHIEKINLMKSIEERKVAAKEFMMQVEAERIAMEREWLSMMKSKEHEMEDERILAINLDTCNPVQKTYYKAKQRKF